MHPLPLPPPTRADPGGALPPASCPVARAATSGPDRADRTATRGEPAATASDASRAVPPPSCPRPACEHPPDPTRAGALRE